MAERRVDLRDGVASESSSVEVIPACCRGLLRRALCPAPAARSVSDTPGCAVSTHRSRTCFSGRASTIAWARAARPSRRRIRLGAPASFGRAASSTDARPALRPRRSSSRRIACTAERSAGAQVVRAAGAEVLDLDRRHPGQARGSSSACRRRRGAR
ncbi:MAG: hypothetical protein IPL61_21985 [Myxococcales bacterium]|nr:hypothetical protein [Myxococcales bacterium]